jgi:hypothetical protein
MASLVTGNPGHDTAGASRHQLCLKTHRITSEFDKVASHQEVLAGNAQHQLESNLCTH